MRYYTSPGVNLNPGECFLGMGKDLRSDHSSARKLEDENLEGHVAWFFNLMTNSTLALLVYLVANLDSNKSSMAYGKCIHQLKSQFYNKLCVRFCFLKFIKYKCILSDSTFGMFLLLRSLFNKPSLLVFDFWPTYP